MKSKFLKKNEVVFVAMGIISIALTLLVLIVVRKRSFGLLLNHLLSGDIIFILKLLFLSAFFFGLQLIFLWWLRKYPALAQKIFGTKTTKKALLLSCAICLFLSAVLCFFTIWCSKNYPISEPEIVFFVLSAPLENTQKGIFVTQFFKFVVAPVFCILAIFILWLAIKKYIYKWICIVFILFFPISFALFWKSFQINVYFDLLKRNKEPAVFSEFWEENFIVPEVNRIEFPEKKRNLIFIMLESMESSFADFENGGLFEKNYIPNLTQLAKENINFSQSENFIGGGLDARATGWTVAAMLAKLGGLPYKLGAASNPSKLPFFLPKATFLTDVLFANGYEMRFLCGSDAGFASRDRLLGDHGNVKIQDLDWYRENGFLPKDYGVFWGFEDFHLYEFAKMELSELSKNEKPFFLSFLTVDTHNPEGFVCSKCEETAVNDSQIQIAIKCADRQIGEFIDWCKTQAWYADTTIVIVGDHLFMLSDETKNSFNQILTGKINRRWIDVFINSAVVPAQNSTKNRQFTSFDIYPTTLASIGAILPEDGLAFGRNLFSGKPTVVEQHGFEYVNAELGKKMSQFEELVY